MAHDEQIMDSLVIDGFRVAIDSGYSRKIMEFLQTGRYEYNERNAAKRMLQSGDRVLELGSAIGVVSMTCASIVGAENVTCVDANPDMISHAKRNFSANLFDIAVKNAVMKSAADWQGDDETVAFYVAANFWASSLLKPTRPVRVVRVPVLCLETEIADTKSNVLICDIEGGEVELLERASLDGIDKIIMETHYGATGVEPANRLVHGLLQRGFSMDLMLTGRGVVCLYKGRPAWWKEWDRDQDPRSTMPNLK